MPRYCAVKLCKNRGGVLSKDNKRISFYPFPLRDQARLQKWVDNMKRQEWTPSRHQYLCSEHFTEDSFDLRWGIRYLKHTAIPTIFPYICDDENNRIPSRKNSKLKVRTYNPSVQLIRSLSPPRKRPLILKDNDFNNNNNSSSNGSISDASVCSPTAVEVKTGDGQVFSVLLMGQLKVETADCLQDEESSLTGPRVRHTDAASPVHVADSDSSLGALTVARSDDQVKNEAGTEEPVCGGPDSPVTALSHVPSTSFTHCTTGVDMTTTTTAEAQSLQTELCGHQSIAITPVMCLQTGEGGRESRGLVVTEAPRGAEDTEGSPDKDEGETEVEVEGEGEGEQEQEQAYLCEHSYSRQDLDHEQLWSRIAALHAKITELDQREEDTLGKIQTAEAELTQLKKQNIVCEEKQKALEEYFTSVFLQ